MLRSVLVSRDAGVGVGARRPSSPIELSWHPGGFVVDAPRGCFRHELDVLESPERRVSGEERDLEVPSRCVPPGVDVRTVPAQGPHLVPKLARREGDLLRDRDRQGEQSGTGKRSTQTGSGRHRFVLRHVDRGISHGPCAESPCPRGGRVRRAGALNLRWGGCPHEVTRGLGTAGDLGPSPRRHERTRPGGKPGATLPRGR